MKYSCTTEISVPRDRVLELFEDRDAMQKWMEGLERCELLSGAAGAAGATYGLTFQMGNRRIEMVETIVERRLPEVVSAEYTAKGVWNRNANHFHDMGAGRTRWRIEAEFKFGLMMRLMSLIVPGMFRRQTMKTMHDFKRFAEAS